jgi:lambda repressor-like predicted transcriptional regulator
MERYMESSGLSLREIAKRAQVTYDSLKDFKWGPRRC